MLESSGVVSGVGSEGNKRSLEDEGSSSKEGSSSSANPTSKRAKQDLQSLPTRQYLDKTVVPLLMDALAGMVTIKFGSELPNFNEKL